MSEKQSLLKRYQELLDKSRDEFKQAAQCLIDALSHIHERLERVEKWMQENKK